MANSKNAAAIPQVFRSLQNELTLESAILQPSRINYLKNNNRTELELILLVMLENLSGAFNVKNDFTAAQIEDTILTICGEKDFGQLAPEEILYVFRCAKTGKYGPVYNKLDCITICGWLRTYMEGERLYYFQQQANETVAHRGRPEQQIAALLPPSNEPAKDQLQFIKDQDHAKLRERLRTQMERYNQRAQEQKEKVEQ